VSSGPYPTKASKANRGHNALAPAAAARVQDIARRCATAAKATRTAKRTPSAASRSTASSNSPGAQQRANMGPPFTEQYGGSTEMPPPPVPQQAQQQAQQSQIGVPSNSFVQQPQTNGVVVNGAVPVQNGTVSMEAPNYAAFVPQAQMQFQQPVPQWTWAPGGQG
jgi:hypothetical protein